MKKIISIIFVFLTDPLRHRKLTFQETKKGADSHEKIMKITMLIAEKTVSKALFTLYIICVGYII